MARRDKNRAGKLFYGQAGYCWSGRLVPARLDGVEIKVLRTLSAAAISSIYWDCCSSIGDICFLQEDSTFVYGLVVLFGK